MRVSHRDNLISLCCWLQTLIYSFLKRLLKTAFFPFYHRVAWKTEIMIALPPYNTCHLYMSTVCYCSTAHFGKVFKNNSWTCPRPGRFYRQLSTIQVNNRNNSAMLPSYSSHSSPRRHTQWLHPARVRTAAPTTVAAVTVVLLVGTSSAKPTSTSEACPPQPQTMTWSSSVSREYHTSSLHYLILTTYWFFPGLDCHFSDFF